MANVQEANLVDEATGSTAATEMIQTTLQQTWFAIPGGDSLFAPATGSRPGDPLADWMFSLLVSRMLEQINNKLETDEQFQDNLTLANNTTWVDDMVFMIEGEASTIVDKAAAVMAEVLQICTEHGFRLSYGQGKTALMVDFRGAHSRKCRQQFEQAHKQMMPIVTEYETVNVPLVSFYKHLGGHITRNGDVAPEIRTRAGQALARVVPLKRLVKSKEIAVEQRRLILKSFIIPIVTLHSGTWFHLGLMEYKTWQAALHKIYACMHDRTQDGQVQHLTLHELAKHIQAPMPMEMLHVMKLRLCAQILQSNDPFLISAILRNHAAAGQGSWLSGVFNSFQWLEDQIGGFDVPQDVRRLTDQTVWTTLQPYSKILRKQIKQAIKAHMWRLRIHCEVMDNEAQHRRILHEMGWRNRMHDIEAQVYEPAEEEHACETCGKTFMTAAALATHEQRKHEGRIALRRWAIDSVCRVCGKIYHQRTTLLQHWHRGSATCWYQIMRSCTPISSEQAVHLDDQDRKHGLAMHQQGLKDRQQDMACRPATDLELQGGLEMQTPFDDSPPTEEEIQRWEQFGFLPAGQGGRSHTARKPSPITLPNVIEDTQRFEREMLEQVSDWEPDQHS